MKRLDVLVTDPDLSSDLPRMGTVPEGEGPEFYRTLSKTFKWLSAVATLILALGILVLAFTPPSAAISGGLNDKVLHLLAFATLVLPCAIFIKRRLSWMVIGAIALGGFIEILQPSFARDASWGDFLADICGIAVGVALGLAVRALIKKLLFASGKEAASQ